MAEQQPQKPRLGDILVEQGFITQEHIDIALKIQVVKRKFLGEILKDLGFISSTELALALARQAHLKYVDLAETPTSKDALSTLNYNEAKQMRIIPLDKQDNTIVVAIDDPFDMRKEADVKRRFAGLNVDFVVAASDALKKYIEIYYRMLYNPLEKELETEIKKFAAGGGDIIKYTDLILDLAVYHNASDIHINPLDDMSYLFIRIDGLLHNIAVIPVYVHNNVTSRIKLLSEINIAERRIPQDGSFTYDTLGLTVDVRVSTLPTAFGEKIVMRVLKKDISRLNLIFLGYLPEQLDILREAANLPYGMVLVSGPTGSGKSTTLYSMLRAVDYLKRNVVTVEDPIEYNFNFIYQTEVNTSAGYRFSTALKYLMRQDPDVILVGEIRDEETADMCVMASNTGHLVLSTIHANEAITTIQRLLTLTTEKETTLSTIKVIAAQRLLRKLCPYCRKDAPELAEQLLKKYPYLKEHITFEPHTYVHVGCERCRKTGYVGRTTVAEVLKFDDEIIDAFLQDKTIVELHDLLRQKGFLNMNDVGVLKVLMGETDYDEVKRVVQAG